VLDCFYVGGLLFGYDTAVISGAVRAIDVNFIEPLNLPETARSPVGWTVSSALFDCIIGAVIAGWVGKRLGRKGACWARPPSSCCRRWARPIPSSASGQSAAWGRGR
jgi:MFS family permease